MARRKLGRGLDMLIGRGSRDGPPVEEAAGSRESGGGDATPADWERPSVPAEKARADRQAPQGTPGRRRRPGSNGSPAAAAVSDPAPGGQREALEIRQLHPDHIQLNPRQPRKRFAAEELQALKTSVAREGVLQPILVREFEGAYQLIAGERRLRAAQELKLEEIPARVVHVADERLMELALIENIHRANLNPIELADAYHELMERNSWTQEKLAEKLGVSRPVVANTLRLLDLPDDMQKALIRGQITVGHAKVLLSILDDEERHVLFDRIAEDDLSVRDLEEVRAFEENKNQEENKRSRKKPRRRPAKKPYIVSLEEEIAERLGTRVRITELKNGRGVLSLEFYSKEDFERLRSLLLN